MTLKFYKYQGAGNDFILIDNRSKEFDPTNHDIVKHLCDRRFGIGADGVMLLQNAENFDFEMIYYNADGQFGSMCGNGGRCIVAFAKRLGIINIETNFLAADGPHFAKVDNQNHWVSLQMLDVDTISRDNDAYVLNTGSPHYVTILKNVKNLNVVNMGREIRNHPNYIQQGINVNFVEQTANGLILRTYERGVEDETLACGTGATAAALAIAIQDNCIGHNVTEIEVMGGKLSIDFHYDGTSFTEIHLNGPASFVFEGEIVI